MRTCNTCHLDQPIDRFYKNREGYSYKCKSCCSKYQLEICKKRDSKPIRSDYLNCAIKMSDGSIIYTSKMEPGDDIKLKSEGYGFIFKKDK